ncbi:MAG: hypothetical protein GYB67_05040 [Chloroflexi bacterium]|nr:hypothetical protein [Chloroflexota bacterium]
MFKPYRALSILAMLALIALVGCDTLGGPAEPTPVPFNRFTADDVVNAFQAAGLNFTVDPPDRTGGFVARGAPNSHSDRVTFVIAQVAPNGGQILVFDTPEALAEWERYIAQLRTNSATRRDVVYVYTNANIMLQVNANLTGVQARAYETALMGLGS